MPLVLKNARKRRKLPRPGRRKSARQKIEATKDVATLEMSWVKKKRNPGKIWKSARRRLHGEVQSTKIGPLDRSDIHTHTHRYGEQQWSIPSVNDLIVGLLHARKPGVMNNHIAILDAEGRVVGYYSWRAAKRLVNSRKEEFEALIRRLEKEEKKVDKKRSPITKRNMTRRMIQELEKEGYIVTRRTAMPGYEYVASGVFWKKRRK
jgi:hypothetical protein